MNQFNSQEINCPCFKNPTVALYFKKNTFIFMIHLNMYL